MTTVSAGARATTKTIVIARHRTIREAALTGRNSPTEPRMYIRGFEGAAMSTGARTIEITLHLVTTPRFRDWNLLLPNRLHHRRVAQAEVRILRILPHVRAALS